MTEIPTLAAVPSTAAPARRDSSAADAAGWSVIGGFIVGAMALAVVSPIAVTAVVLAIDTLF